MAILGAVEKMNDKEAAFANTKTMTPVYFLGFWQEDRLTLIRTTLKVINITLSGTWPIDRSQFQQAIQYLEELSMYAWKNETVRVTKETDPQDLVEILDLNSK